MSSRGLFQRLRDRIRARDPERDLRDQIDSHIEEATEEYTRQGMSPAEARRAALRSFGGVAQAEELARDARGRWLADLKRDVVYGWRSLARTPGFTAIALLSLSMGIGANTVVFSFINALLLKPLPVSNPAEIVQVYAGERERPYETMSYPSYLEFRDRNAVLSGLAAYGLRQFRLTDANQADEIWGEAVSGNYFDVLGLPAFKGRLLGAGDDGAPGAHPVAVISHSLWTRRYNADPDFVGRAIVVNNQSLTVVGIAPPQYAGIFRGLASDVWVPVPMMPLVEPRSGPAMLTSRGSRWCALIGRLKPDIPLAQARERFESLALEMQTTHPEEWRAPHGESGTIRELFATLLPESETRVHPSMQADALAVVGLVMVVVNVVLVIACLNLAGMLLARSITRRKEMAIRLALGAGRSRLVRQLITESVLLSLCAGAAGVVLTVWLIHLFTAFVPPLPEGIHIVLDLQIDWRVLAYAITFSTIIGVLFGLGPALRSARADLTSAFKDDGLSVTAGHRQSRIRRTLVVAQVAFSVVLLIGAGLLLRSLVNVTPLRLGFTSSNVLVVPVMLDKTRYDRAGRQAFFQSLTERVSSLTGVETVSLIDGPPGGFMSGSRRGTSIEGYEPAPGEDMEIESAFAGPRYFTNMKVPIVQGRDFDDRDREGAPCAAIVNDAFVRRYLASADSPIGRHLTKIEESPATRQTCAIVGVIKDERWQSLEPSPRPFHALAAYQSERAYLMLLVGTRGNPAVHVAPVRSVIRDLDPAIPLAEVQTLNEYYNTLAYPFRMIGLVMGGCGVMALLLATIGIYGLVSYSVAQRTREVGVRVALGALKHDIVRLVVGQGMRLVAWGLVIGLAIGAAIFRLMADSMFGTQMLFGVSTTDVPTFAGVAVLLVAVAFAACYLPARRATTIDPIETLRSE